VGIKTEYIKHYYHPNQSPEAVQDAFKIAKKAAELGIGPELYDLFVTKDTKEKVIIVKVSKIIDGKTWADTEWETPEQRHAAAEQLKTAIQNLNEAGIIHHDLHSGNVMVDTTGRV
jgi:tRNA A-37 threonylcarbamoyl transferase component Bud32